MTWNHAIEHPHYIPHTQIHTNLSKKKQENKTIVTDNNDTEWLEKNNCGRVKLLNTSN